MPLYWGLHALQRRRELYYSKASIRAYMRAKAATSFFHELVSIKNISKRAIRNKLPLLLKCTQVSFKTSFASSLVGKCIILGSVQVSKRFSNLVHKQLGLQDVALLAKSAPNCSAWRRR